MISDITSVTAFCGSHCGRDPLYQKTAEELGAALARAGVRLVYGGGSVGLMNTLATAHTANGGKTCGIIPDFLKKREGMHTRIDELIVTTTMHERKEKLYELADAFIILPGGVGTFDEAFETLTWRQLGLHGKPIIVVNVAGWADPFLNLLNHIVDEGFAGPETRNLLTPVPDAGAAMAVLFSEK